MDEKKKVLRLLQLYNARIEADSLDLTNYVFRSACYEYLNEYRHSLRDALKINYNDPTYWKGPHQAMKMYIKLGKISEAEKIAEKLKENDLFGKISLELYQLKDMDEHISLLKNEK